jgi:tight adherence protein B
MTITWAGPVVLAALLTAAFAAAVIASQLHGRERLLVRAGGLPRSSGTRKSTVVSFGSHRKRRLMTVFAPVGGLLLGFIAAGPAGGVMGALVGLVAPRSAHRARQRRTAEALDRQLAVTVSGIAAALRAGLSLSQAIRFAAEESAEPVRRTIGEVIDREALGVPLEESLDRWAAGSRSGDVRLVASVLRLRVGAGLPAVLDQVARTLRQKESSRREVRSLTAQARLSGTILGLLPIGFFLFLSATSRQDMAAAYGSPVGVAAIVTGLGLEACAYGWIRRLLRVPA